MTTTGHPAHMTDLSNGNGAAWTTGPDATAHFTVTVSRRRNGALRIAVRRTVQL